MFFFRCTLCYNDGTRFKHPGCGDSAAAVELWFYFPLALKCNGSSRWLVLGGRSSFLCLSCGVTGFITCRWRLRGADSGGSRWLIITTLLMPTDPVAANPPVHLPQLGGGCLFTAGQRFASSFQSLGTLCCHTQRTN